MSGIKDQVLPYIAVEEDMDEDLCIKEGDPDSEATKRLMYLQRKSFWNLFIFNVCYFLTYTGISTLSNFQSTMNASQGMGADSQAVIFFFSMLSSVLLPTYTIGRFGCKAVLVVGTVICTLNMASNAYLRWDTLMTASALYGLINGPYQSAISLYIDEMATRFQGTVKKHTEFVMALFFGLFMVFSEATSISGNLISYYVFKNNLSDPTQGNTTVLSECGVHFKPSDNDTNANLDPPTQSKRFILVGIFVLLGTASALILGFFLEPLKNDLQQSKGCRSIVDRFLSAFKFLRNPHQLLLIPLAVFNGIQSAFYSIDVTQAYIACSWGVHHVGFVTVCFGVCGALMSLLVGPLVKCISQMAVLVLAACANVAICIVLYLWQPSPDFPPAYFIIAGVWGMGDAIWWSQVTALYGLMFPNDREAAFSNLYFWSFLGFFLSYSYANYFTVAVKINILLCFLVTGMIGYLIGQIKIKCAPAVKDYVTIPNSEDE